MLLLVGIFIYGFLAKEKISQDAQAQWFNFSEKIRQTFENENSCCGFTRKEEGVEGCFFNNPCGSIFLATLEKIANLGIVTCGFSEISIVKKY